MRSSVGSGFRFAIAKPIPYSIAYAILAIALLTLNPFHLQAYDPAEWWVWRFWPSDVCQNVLLFLPLGMLLRHHTRFSYGLCLASGFLLSLSIECTQLFIAERTSNGIDLLANSAGCIVGAWLYQWGAAGQGWQPEQPLKLNAAHQPHINIALALMLLPLCWTRGMIAEWLPNGIWILLPNAIALLTLLESRPQSSARPSHRGSLALNRIPLNFIHLNMAQWAWLALALLPAITYAPFQLTVIAGAALLVYLIARKSPLSNPGLSCTAMGLGLGGLLDQNCSWLKSQTLYIGETWYNLLWIEILLSVLLTAAVASQPIAEKKRQGSVLSSSSHSTSVAQFLSNKT